MAFGLIPSVTHLCTSKAFQMSGLVLRCSHIFTMSNSTAHAMTTSFSSEHFIKPCSWSFISTQLPQSLLSTFGVIQVSDHFILLFILLPYSTVLAIAIQKHVLNPEQFHKITCEFHYHSFPRFRKTASNGILGIV